MTYSTSFSAFKPSFDEPKSRYMKSSLKLYQLEVYGFDGEYETLEVEARSHSEAASQAESLVDFFIYHVNVYLV